MASKYMPMRLRILEHLMATFDGLGSHLETADLTNNPFAKFFMERDGLTVEQVRTQMIVDRVDILTCIVTLKAAKTIVIDSGFAIDLRGALTEFDETLDVKPPFDDIVFQFTSPLPERDFFEIEPKHWAGGDDKIIAVIYSHVADAEGDWHNASLYFTSGEISRVKWRVGERPEQYINYDVAREGGANKPLIMGMVLGILVYLSCENVAIDRVEVPASTIRKRAKAGKAPIEDYYVTYIRKEVAERKAAPGSSGRHVSYRFEVSAHARTYKSGKRIWIAKHERGLAYEPKAQERIYAIAGERRGK